MRRVLPKRFTQSLQEAKGICKRVVNENSKDSRGGGSVDNWQRFDELASYAE